MNTITVTPNEEQIRLAKELAVQLSKVAAAYPLPVQNVAAQMLLQGLIATIHPAQRTQAMSLMFRGIRENTKAYTRMQMQTKTREAAHGP
jgi:hypothetical protein